MTLSPSEIQVIREWLTRHNLLSPDMEMLCDMALREARRRRARKRPSMIWRNGTPK
jgi:hypothetical protein